MKALFIRGLFSFWRKKCLAKNKTFKRSVVTSRWYCLRCGHKTILLREKDSVEFKSSKILEGWFDIYIDGNYNGTIPEKEFRMNFRCDNLIM